MKYPEIIRHFKLLKRLMKDHKDFTHVSISDVDGFRTGADLRFKFKGSKEGLACNLIARPNASSMELSAIKLKYGNITDSSKVKIWHLTSYDQSFTSIYNRLKEFYGTTSL